MRLVGGTSANEGRVEILHNGRWGTVCRNGWGDVDARVVCDQLGYFGEANAVSGNQFGSGKHCRLCSYLYTDMTLLITLSCLFTAPPPSSHFQLQTVFRS